MAGVISYNSSYSNYGHIFRATSGGTVFSADLAGSAVFDYFTDTAVVNDALYFSGIAGGSYYIPYSDIKLNVGTAFAATSYTLVWEYYHFPLAAWVPIPNLTDDTASLSVTGANTVHFPIPPYGNYQTINAVAGRWVRCRLSAVSGITEGGANQTATPQYANGYVTITGYTAGTPLTCTTLYNWIIANTPIPAMKRCNYFEFPCAINNADNSYWQTRNEIILIGNGAGYITTNLGQIVAGTTVGTSGGENGSIILLCIQTGGQTVTSTVATLYNSVIRRGYYSDTANGYDGISGLIPARLSLGGMTAQASMFEGAGYINSSSNLARCILTGGEISVNAIADSSKLANAIFCASTTLFNLYATSETYRDIVWSAPTYFMQTNPATSGSPVMTFINPTPKLPDANTSVAPYLWDTSVGTYNQNITIDEKFTLDLTVLDTSGNAISGATVVSKNASGTQDFSVTTASDGTITQQLLLARHFYYDGANSNTNHVASTDTLVHTLTISKTGYQTKTVKLTLNQKQVQVASLEASVSVIFPLGRKMYKNLQPTNTQNKVAWLPLL